MAKRRNGRQTRGSGSSWKNKSDVVEDDVRWEMKATGKTQMTIKGTDLDKIELEALSTDRMPAFHIEIGEKRSGKPRRWVLITEDDFDEAFPPA